MKNKTGNIEIQLDDGILTAYFEIEFGEKSNDRFEQNDPDEIEYKNVLLSCEQEEFYLDINKLRESILEQMNEAVYNKIS